MVALISLRALDRSSPTKGLTHRKRPERTMRDPEHKTDISRQYALCGLALMQTNNCSSNAGMKTSSAARLSPCQISDVLKPFFLRQRYILQTTHSEGLPCAPDLPGTNRRRPLARPLDETNKPRSRRNFHGPQPNQPSARFLLEFLMESPVPFQPVFLAGAVAGVDCEVVCLGPPLGKCHNVVAVGLLLVSVAP